MGRAVRLADLEVGTVTVPTTTAIATCPRIRVLLACCDPPLSLIRDAADAANGLDRATPPRP
jgi:hypothetical protein